MLNKRTITQQGWYVTTVSGQLWNRQRDASLLVWRFPNAVSPVKLVMGNDERKLALGFDQIEISLQMQ
ncbi:MAG: hypothetical protein JO308_03880 [Verrucomicrobia bacterium]|nr:hypothetical protein [Verrucomicrobiota bacterium]